MKFQKVSKLIYFLKIFTGVVKKKLDLCDKKMEGLDKKFSEFEEKNKEQQKEFNDLKNEFLKFKEEYEQLVKIVLENKEQIDSLFGRLNETIQNCKEGDENLKKKIDALKKYTDDKLLELNTKLELLLNNMNAGGGGGKEGGDKRFDLSGLDDFMQKLNKLENKFEEFITKINIDEIYSQLKHLNETKADKFDLDQVKEVVNDLNKKYQDHQEQIETIINRLDSLYTQIVNISKEPLPVKKDDKKEKDENKEDEEKKKKYSIDIDSLDMSKYTLRTDFDSFVKDNDYERNKIKDELKKLNDLIEELTNLIKEKADGDDLNELRDFLLNKIDDLINDFNKKFADKNETIKNIKYLNEHIKKLYSLLKSSKKEMHSLHDTDNWLLAKKPINGFSCAACESYIGDLKNDKNKYIAWNKLPVRDPGDKLYRMGNGFSKMLNMLNFDNYGNVSLNPNNSINSNDSENEEESNDKEQKININMNELKQKNIKSNNKTLLKNRFQSASTSLIKENKDNKNIKLGHRTQNNFFNKEEIKNRFLPKLKKEMSADVFEIIKENKEEKPKITKIMKKTHKKYHIKENIN